MLLQVTFMSVVPSLTAGDFPEDPLQLVPPLNKPHDIYSRVNMLKELRKCIFLLLTCCSPSVVATACSIVGCHVTERLNRLSILLGFNGVDRGAPTCGES